MNSVTRYLYSMKFRVATVELRGDSYQNLFSKIMEMRHGGDFIRLKPAGKVGDLKNDGYIKSARTLFQVYAPSSGDVNSWSSKIRKDYIGARQHWLKHMDAWKFAHNSWDGVYAPAVKTLEDLAAEYRDVELSFFDPVELRQTALQLPHEQLAEILGLVPTDQDFVDLRYDDINAVIRELMATSPPADGEIREVPPGKIAFNSLSDEVVNLLQWATKKTDQVRALVTNYPTDPTIGDRVAHTLNQFYFSWNTIGTSPDEIFGELFTHLMGDSNPSPKRQVAALAVLAYYFEECDIFERPTEEWLHAHANEAAFN